MGFKSSPASFRPPAQLWIMLERHSCMSAYMCSHSGEKAFEISVDVWAPNQRPQGISRPVGRKGCAGMAQVILKVLDVGKVGPYFAPLQAKEMKGMTCQGKGDRDPLGGCGFRSGCCRTICRSRIRIAGCILTSIVIALSMRDDESWACQARAGFAGKRKHKRQPAQPDMIPWAHHAVSLCMT